MFSETQENQKQDLEEKEQLPEYKGLKTKDIEYYDKIKEILLGAGKYLFKFRLF